MPTSINSTQVVFPNGTTQASNALPSGAIIVWSGAIANIPAGWFLCNGTNGTPDLRDRFVVGATSTYAVGATGGSRDSVVISHSHTATVSDPGHTHSYFLFTPAPIRAGSNGPVPNPVNDGVTGTSTTGISVALSPTGSSGTNANLPPYYALAYIMKS
jgi:hypothetical protein